MFTYINLGHEVSSVVTYNTDIGEIVTLITKHYKLLICLVRLTKRQHEFKLAPSHFKSSEMSVDCRLMSVIFSVRTQNHFVNGNSFIHIKHQFIGKFKGYITLNDNGISLAERCSNVPLMYMTLAASSSGNVRIWQLQVASLSNLYKYYLILINKILVKEFMLGIGTLRTFLDETLDPIHIRSGPAMDTIDFRCLFSVTCWVKTLSDFFKKNWYTMQQFIC